MTQRPYKITNTQTGEHTFVVASSRAQAVAHEANGLFTAAPASALDMIGVKVSYASQPVVDEPAHVIGEVA
jgi:hypothetical protein